MITMKQINASVAEEREAFFQLLDERTGETNQRVTETVQEILKTVKAGGDDAVKNYTLKFDGSLPEYYEVPREVINDALTDADQAFVDAMLNAIEKVNAKNIFILPNNKNIVMAANQARDLTEDKDIIVIPTKTVPQGITAVLNYNAEEDVDTNEETMLEAIKCVKTGQVTYAVRDTHIDDKEIHEGDIMGIGDAGILAVGKSVDGTTKDMLAQLVNDDSELISLYYGEEVSEEEAEKLTAEIEELYPDMDVDAHMGGQPIYYYVLAVE